MSWRGFLCLVRDFGIASKPSRKTKFGASFPHEIWKAGSAIAGLSASGHVGQAPLTMLDTACIFVEASKSAHPIVMLRKYMQHYMETQQNMKEDPWRTVGEWIDSEDWNIPYGLNFGQFCDALAKCGAYAYSAPIFAEALPTTQEKIEHFFTAYLGLTDAENWKTKIEQKLQVAKEAIAKVKNVKVLKSPTKTKTGMQII